MDVDWSAIEDVCQERAVALDRNDPDVLWEQDRERFSRQHPVEHSKVCNLHPDYSKDPRVWARGCDCGAIARAAQGKRQHPG